MEGEGVGGSEKLSAAIQKRPAALTTQELASGAHVSTPLLPGTKNNLFGLVNPGASLLR